MPLNSQKKRESPQKVFVYGTLKKGYPNHMGYLTGARGLGDATVPGIMFHLHGFPAINISEAFCDIKGEVYEVSWDHIVDMDNLEGIGRGFYERAEIRVKPHGVVWTYFFPSEKAAKLEHIIPKGEWLGPNTPKMKWLGFGKGIHVGSFSTNNGRSEIKVGGGDGHFSLKFSPLDGTYKLTDTRTNTILGSYKYLADILNSDKKILRLPSKMRTTPDQTVNPEPAAQPTMPQLVDQAIRKTLLEDSSKYAPAPRQTTIDNIPIVVIGKDKEDKEKEKEEDLPQAARLMGIKYGAAK